MKVSNTSIEWRELCAKNMHFTFETKRVHVLSIERALLYLHRKKNDRDLLLYGLLAAASGVLLLCF